MIKKQKTRRTAHELGTERLGKLLIQYSLPAIIATASASLYNVIDRIIIGQGVGPMAISGLALTFPLMNLMAAFGSMVGVGAGALVSIFLGKHDRKTATEILGNAIVLNLIIGTSIAILTYIFLEPILYAMGGSSETVPYAKEFMQVLLFGSVFAYIYYGLNNVMRASGYPEKAMINTLVTVGVNLVLAPVFIFGFKWGIKGAALATVFAQFSGAILTFFHFTKIKSFLHFLPGYFKLKFSIIKKIVSVGMSNFLMLICSSIVISILNIGLRKYGGDLAIGAFGIISSIGNLTAMIVLGFNQGMQPIVGYNYGAQQIPRALRTFKLTILAGTCVTVFGFLISELFPHIIVSAFTTDHQLIDLSVPAMRITFIMFPIIGFQMVTSNFFQSIGKAKVSIFLSLTRQVLFLIPALLILPIFFKLNGVWFAMPAADFTSSLLTFFILRWQIKKIKSNYNKSLIFS